MERDLDRDQMDIERLDRRCPAERWHAAGRPDVALFYCQVRRSRREMTMEYIGFTMIVAAGGAIVFWFWRRSYRAGLEAGRPGRMKNGLPEPPVPPFKRTIGGPSEAELKQLEFERRIEEWQKRHPVLGFQTNARLDALKGEKYTFVPRTRSGERASSSA